MKQMDTSPDRMYARAAAIVVAALFLALAVIESMGADGLQSADAPALWLAVITERFTERGLFTGIAP